MLQKVVLEHGTVSNTHKKRGIETEEVKKCTNNLDVLVLKTRLGLQKY